MGVSDAGLDANCPVDRTFPGDGRELRRFLGFGRSVIVQATCHGADNSALVDALVAAGGRARGVATVRPGVGFR